MSTNVIYICEIATIIVAVITMIFTLSVVFILILKYKKLVQGQLLAYNVLMIAICDTVVAFTYALGYPNANETGLCKFQGFLALNSERASWFWTDLLIVNAYGAIVCQKYIIKNVWHMHIIIWSFILILALLPLINGVGYGSTVPDVRCGYTSKQHSSHAKGIWGQVQDWIALSSLFFIILVTIRIYFYAYYSSYDVFKARNIDALNTVLLYPLAMLICWLPSQLEGIIIPATTTSKQDADIINNATHIIAPMYGLLLTLIYYFQTELAIKEWKNIFRYLISSDTKEFDEIELRDSNRESDAITVKNIIGVRISESKESKSMDFV